MGVRKDEPKKVELTKDDEWMSEYHRTSFISLYFMVYRKIKWPLVIGLVAMQLFLFMSLFQNLKADPVSLQNIQVAIRDLVLIYIIKSLTETLMKVEEMRKKFNESVQRHAMERKEREEKRAAEACGLRVL